MQSLAYAYETGAKFWKTMEIRENIRKYIIKKIWADLSENRLNSDNFITIPQKIPENFQLPPWKGSAPYAYEAWTRFVRTIVLKTE